MMAERTGRALEQLAGADKTLNRDERRAKVRTCIEMAR